MSPGCIFSPEPKLGVLRFVKMKSSVVTAKAVAIEYAESPDRTVYCWHRTVPTAGASVTSLHVSHSPIFEAGTGSLIHSASWRMVRTQTSGFAIAYSMNWLSSAVVLSLNHCKFGACVMGSGQIGRSATRSYTSIKFNARTGACRYTPNGALLLA